MSRRATVEEVDDERDRFTPFPLADGNSEPFLHILDLLPGPCAYPPGYSLAGYLPNPTNGMKALPIVKLYGRPDNLLPEKPDLMSEQFKWDEASVSQAPHPSLVLEPAPAITPPPGYYYPLAATYTLTPDVDRRFARGCAYVTLFSSANKGILQSKLLRTKTPPNVIPRIHESRIVVDPIAGMIRMPGSVPFVQHTKEHPDEVVTMACAHTLGSIREAYPDIADRVDGLAADLRDATFGCSAQEGRPAMQPIYSMAGLKRNARSVNESALPPGSYDGSYNLASTKGEGEGAGVAMPAVQASTPEAAQRISLVLRLLHAIQRLVLPRSITKFEHNVTEAHSELNNVVSFGGLDPGSTSCQMNVSSGGYDLAHFIGAHQGSWHTDIGDDWTRWTMVTMVLKLPEGSDPGAFCLARCGLYVREADTWIVFLVFRGNDLHSGFAPTTPPIPMADVDTALAAAGPNRVVYVSYPSRISTTRVGSMSMTPPTGFGNFGTMTLAKTEQRHYSDRSSNQVFGSTFSKANRLAREAGMSFLNSLKHSGINLGQSLTELLGVMTYQDEEGETQQIEPPPFDIKHQASQMSRWWRFYEWHRELCATYAIRMTKSEYKKAQAALASGESLDSSKAPHAQLQEVPATVVGQPEGVRPSDDSTPEHVVDTIVERRVIDGKLTWFVKLDGKDEVTPVGQGESWIHHVRNEPKFAQFIARSHTSGENPINLHTVISEPEDSPMIDAPAVPLPHSEAPREQTPMAAPAVAGTCIPTRILRSRPGEREGNPADDDDDLDDGEYYIKEIVDMRTDGTEPTWRVRWEGYTEEHDVWMTQIELSGAQEVLADYNDKHNIVCPPLIVMSPRGSSPTPSVESDYIPPIETHLGSKRAHLSDSDEAQPDEGGGNQLEDEVDELEDEESVICLQADKLADLEKLFDSEFRELEHEALAATEENLKRNKQYFTPVASSAIVEALVSQNELQTQFNDYMSFVPKLSMHAPSWTQHSAVLSLGRVVQATGVLPDLVTNEIKTLILDRSLRWEIARSHLLLYSWYQSTGPRLAQMLFDLHRSGYHTPQGGFPAVYKVHPTFAALVHHIVLYVTAQAENKREAVKAKRRKTTTAAPRHHPIALIPHPQCPMPIPPTDIRSLPFDLYGLRDSPPKKTTSKPKRIPLSLPREKLSLKNIDDIYRCSVTMLQEIWSTELILPPVASLDKSCSATARLKPEELARLKSKVIARGAVLRCIVDACGGDESLLASSDIEAIISAPSKIFASRITKEARFSAAVLKDSQKTLAPLADWLAVRLSEQPNILQFAASSARIVHRGLLELHYGVTLNDEHYLNPDLLYDEAEEAPFVAPQARRHIAQKANTYYAAPTLDSLLPNVNAPHFGAIGLILRERCNELRGFGAANHILHNVLQGKHPTQGRVQFDRDQTDPARQFSEYATLLAEALPVFKLTDRLGLSRLLAYMGTGQGGRTSQFVKTGWNPDLGQYPMAFDSLAACISHFENAEMNNLTVLTDNRAVPGSRAARLPGYKQTYNACIWGQASNHLLLLPTFGKGESKRKYTFPEKFAPYFSEAVQDKWCAWLGGLLDRDPSTYTGPKKTWADALRFILDLGVLGFQTGLTPLQLANNLVFLGICEPPEAMEVGDWVAHNKSLGAYNGLVHLGFSMTGYTSIVSAYMVVYSHLDTYLCADDKQRLGFGALFVEHVLCKVGRWEGRLRLQKHDFMLMAKQARIEQDGIWVKGANCTDLRAFPIPLQADRTAIQGTIDFCMSSM
ncbi:hypothetical protein C8R46DRAFT_1344751 [Mycena filopes]|nr:hypothetical protein C8R46DRAFT_1347932 [Mycena filopes]KAJ7182152.1 hypothetical protein C8R46DRAFT_1344751 [Mycena filopes]